MSDMASINQNGDPVALPNFRNLGVMLRVLLIANAMALAAAVLKAPSLETTGRQLVEISTLFQPILLLTLLALVAVESRAAEDFISGRDPRGAGTRGTGHDPRVALRRDAVWTAADSARAAHRCARGVRPHRELLQHAQPPAVAGAHHRATAGAAGAHPTALSLQQPERGALADPCRATPCRDSARRPRRSLPRADAG